MKRLIFFVLLVLAVPFVLTHLKITDFGVMQSRKEYAQVFKTGKGNVYVFDKRVTHENEHEFRLPATHEHLDERLYEMLLLMEGNDGAVDLYKGITKGVLTTMGANLGGGSNLTTSVAGSLLDNRVQANADVFIKTFNRTKEWILVGYINNLPKKTKTQLVLSESCQAGSITGCTLVSSQLWHRMPTSDTERLLLASTVRYPLSKQNQTKLADYMSVWCKSPRLKEFQFDSCNFDGFLGNIIEKQEGGVRLSNQINQVVAVRDDALKPIDIITIVDTVKGIKHADVEIQIHRIGDEGTLFRATNNALLLRKGFPSSTNVASVAKLLLFINKNNQLPQKSVDCLARSDNDCVYDLFNEFYSEFEMVKGIRELGIEARHRDSHLIHAASFGNLAMSTQDIHILLEALARQRDEMPLINQYAMKAAVNANGTLAYANNAFRHVNVIVAKSGTHANRSVQPVGVLGSLAVFVVKSGNEMYSISIRLHGRKGVICVASNCTKNTMRQLTKLSGHVLHAITHQN